MKPFIHLFKTPKNYYFYDVNRNENIRIEKEVYEYLDKVLKDEINEEIDEETKVRVKELQEGGFLSENNIETIDNTIDEELISILLRNSEMLILQITQKCNLRCSYCPYTNNDGTNRKHSNKSMTLEMAQKSIDYYYTNSIDSDTAVLNFYGGEPLIEFNLIKECVEYFKDKFPNKPKRFYITTNGTIINKKILSFLEEEGFSVTISLDGIMNVNDRNRKFKNVEKSVYKIVMKNLIYIRNNYKQLYKKININVVMDQRMDFEDYINFINVLTKKGIEDIRITTIDDTSMEEVIYSSNEFKSKYYYHHFLSYMYLLGKIQNVNNTIINHFNDSCVDILNNLTKTRKLSSRGKPSGVCLVGKQRMMVNVNGFIFPCEKVSELIKRNCIGHVEYGIDLCKANKLMNVHNLNSINCKNCFAIRNCSLCQKSFEIYKNNNKFSLNCNNCKNTFHCKLIAMEILNEIRYGCDA